MSSIRHNLLYLFVLACIQIIGIGLFAKGFFPYKIYLSGFATQQDVPLSLADDLHKHYWQESVFDRLAFIVIDALRNTLTSCLLFIFFYQIEYGTAIPFTAKATAPTVTMPRIKALTTGTIPSFLDAILNIAESDTSSSLDFHDNWVHQLKKANKTMYFFGDDTWIRLFPGLFDKTDGTTSFYVSDTVQVDLNVSRHIQQDIAKERWDVLIMHYLGLDHIGHLGGPNSPLMQPKQREMDEAIESIFDIVSKQDAERLVSDPKAKGTLIVICGDHGMNDNGNHGGSSTGETSTALVFLSPQFQSRPHFKQAKSTKRSTVFGYPVIDQIDLVPTLASLFSFPIPRNNLGRVITDLLKEEDSKCKTLQLNAFQLAQLLEKMIPTVQKYIREPHLYLDDNASLHGKLYARATVLFEQYLSTQVQQTAHDAITSNNLLLKFIDLTQSELANIASDYKLSYMILGTMLIISSAILFCVWHYQARYKTDQVWKLNWYFSIVFLGAYSISMFASSYVEEEHVTWFYFLQTFILLGVVQRPSTTRSIDIQLWCDCLICSVRLVELLLHTATPLLILLSGTHNAALFLVFYLHYHIFKLWQQYLIEINRLSVSTLAIMMTCLCHASFFMTGHSNSLASVDLSNAYVGVQGYDTLLIGALTFISNWSASVWWVFASWSLIADSCATIDIPKRWVMFIITQSVFFSVALSFLSISVTILREHLFIWTVFSPKYLYQVAWNCLFHWTVQAFIGSLFLVFICNNTID
ncbi:alkaline phosphatase-like protein [Rhizopus microsporus ATCC 52813]|uniref:GPI ethanolamine phosphate transferase 2 n=1 Tax=Rhizopus microsporus ATCC 52813 TaxID=1340429 RepID=A0A2G4T926_RHIZD|nr:alkaline phosphatase-like protein [Rhizopus microsporus ATCC 52813]PHZ17512.1 alkaline phosphatase-like protein [Rhizopus microsporus ATCC 52813]